MKKFFAVVSVLAIGAGVLYYFVSSMEKEEVESEEEGHADEAFEWWYSQRSLPGTTIPPDGIGKALQRTQQMMRAVQKRSSGFEEPWISIGPDNIGGRVLSLAIDPDSSNIIWGGSASGGLWKSKTGGAGERGWEYINTGFYSLSVSTIAINSANSNELYIGTGEISGYNLGQVGTPSARTTYGLGIIKSTDKGTTWQATGLTWNFSQNRSVQKLVINPRKPDVLFAATSEGAYRSDNAGGTFVKILDTLMVMDIAVNPVDTNIIYVACGQRNTSPNPGLYRSTNGGVSFTKMTNGLPTINIGRTSLAIAPSNPSVVYASIANAVSHNVEGLFRTTDGGDSWQKMSPAAPNYLNGQGWYDNIIAVHPNDEHVVFAAGLDIYKSTSGGDTLKQKSLWYAGYDGVIPAGSSEGSLTYAHADHHAIVFDLKNPNRIFFGTDGGIFESTDGGETFSGRNGGFITTQFYNGFDNASDDSLIALGGLQDNGTVKFEGNQSWNKVYGGDGGWCAVDPINKNILYEEYVYLDISKSTNGGASWFSLFTSNSDSSNFIAPFVIAPSQPSVLYAGAKKIFKSTNGGSSWNATNGGSVLNGTNISCIAVSYTSPETLIAATGQRNLPMAFEIFFSTNGGTTWTKSSSSLPNRYPTDISFDPANSTAAYLTFSGYGTPHLFKSTDAGASWNDISSNLPDLPVQSVCVDPLNPSDIYAGTDLGVYRTQNGGAAWEPWFDGMPPAMVLDVAVSKADHKLRAATFGNGVYQRKLAPQRSTNAVAENNSLPTHFSLSQNYPNPFNPVTTIHFTLPSNAFVSLKIYDAAGRETATLVNAQKDAGSYSVHWNAAGLSSGVYFARLSSGKLNDTKKMMLVK